MEKAQPSAPVAASTVVPFFFITIGLTIGFSLIIAQSNFADIMAHWDQRRCDIGPLFTAGLFKPADDPRSSTEFSMDNFTFCTKKIVDDVLKAAFAPLLEVTKQQLKGMDTIGSVMNNIRATLAKSTNGFSSLLSDRYKVFVAVYVQFTRVFQQLQFALGRVNAAVVSMLYLGLSTVAGLLNVYDFVIKVVIIIMTILVIIVILLFFVLFPVIPVILTTITILTAAGLGAAVGGMGGAFCLDPKTYILMADGKSKRLSEIKVGDELLTTDSKTNSVEGILVADGSNTPLFVINGVKLSGSHRVFYNGLPILAQDHPDAKPIDERLSRLICLNTTTHSVPCNGLYGTIEVSDWEEVSSEEASKAWIDFVNKELNSNLFTDIYPDSVPLASETCKVQLESGKIIPLSDVIMNDVLHNGERVIGIYTGSIESPDSQDWMSDGVWIYKANGQWELNKHEESANKGEKHGIFLVTTSGSFNILCNNEWLTVRDFTEVGIDSITKSYELLSNLLTKEKI